jgi:hypothetical protein
VIGSLGKDLTLYFESNRSDPAGTVCRDDGKRRLYFVTYTSGGGFSAPQLVPGLDSGLPNEDDTQISLSQDRKTAFFTRATNAAYGVFTADWSGSSFVNIHQIVMPTLAPPFTGKLVLIGEANRASTPQGQLLYMVCGIAQSETANHDPATQICFARKPN